MRVSVALHLVAVLAIGALCVELNGRASDQRATLKLLTDQQATTRRWQAKYATAASHVERAVDTVTVRVASVRTLRDTLRITDTLQVIAYVARTDSALQACTELASSCSSFRLTADSLLKSQQSVIDWWQRHDKPHHSLRTKLTERVGVTCGYGVTASQGQAYAGPQCGVTIRVFP